ncbi:MAG: MIP/aquaporin family protein [Methanoregulaceae archaeon]
MASLGKRCAAELAGTAILVFFGAGAAAITLMLASGTAPATTFDIGIGALGGLGDWFAIGMAFAIAIAVSIYAFGNISGAHLNPAVTLSLLAVKKFPAGEVIPYIIAQCIGAAAGSLLFAGAAGMNAVTIGSLGATAPFPGISYGQAILAEAIGTFVLVLAIFAITRRGSPPGLAGIIIGLTVGGIITTLGNISGASLNPARTFGPYLIDSVLGGPQLWQYFPIYIFGPVLGGIIAAFFMQWMDEGTS